MRKQSLRQTANRYLKMDNRGSFKDKKQSAFIIHKLIDDLFLIGNVHHAWHFLKKYHIEKLIEFLIISEAWQGNCLKIKPSWTKGGIGRTKVDPIGETVNPYNLYIVQLLEHLGIASDDRLPEEKAVSMRS
ncbi:MAG: hypothetical protein H0U75_12360, partial [Legionella sp.]|nr:hypothetical protein [Legionella sp.]